MAAMRGPRVQVGSAPWVAEERSSALQIAESEVEEFSYSARNELDWLNEHMGGIFDENETNIAENFKTPGKLRGKTPRTARKINGADARLPLSDVFAATPNGHTNRFAQHLNRIQSPNVQFDGIKGSPKLTKSPSPKRQALSPKPTVQYPNILDSGYHGSQEIEGLGNQAVDELTAGQSIGADHVAYHTTTATVPLKQSPSRRGDAESPEKTFQTAKEEQTARVSADAGGKIKDAVAVEPQVEQHDAREQHQSGAAEAKPLQDNKSDTGAPESPEQYQTDEAVAASDQANFDSPHPGARTPSDGSSPIRPMVRKSSLNFASLPAREPLTAGKPAGSRVSRTSHLDYKRVSQYGRVAGGKSLGNHRLHDIDLDDEPADEANSGDQAIASEPKEGDRAPEDYHKTYTQRLQDQIQKLGQSQSFGNGRSKSIVNPTALQQAGNPAAQQEAPKSPPPRRLEPTKTTPGAFPEDDDDWIEPPASSPLKETSPSTRPVFPKSHSADVMEGIHGKDTVSRADFTTEDQFDAATKELMSPKMAPQGHSLSKSVSASNTVIAPISGMEDVQPSPKSPSRHFRDSPLKQVKNKLSSILKSSKGLLASSAALSAEGKSSLLSPSTTRLGLYPSLSSESIIGKLASESLRPQLPAAGTQREASPTRPPPRRTRASEEREKEEKRRDKEAKVQEEQMSKLEKAREQEREKARVFSQEQERIATMEQKMVAKKEAEKLLPKETPKPTRSSPRKAKGADTTSGKVGDADVDMTDAPPTIPQPAPPRSAGPSQVARPKDYRRPVKPVKETPAKSKQAPTVIRVNTGSQHSQYHPTNAASSSAPGERDGTTTQVQPPQSLSSKASKASLHPKPSTQSLRGAASSIRPKTPGLTTKKKEQEEREVQKRREAKAEAERNKVAKEDEQRKQEQQRRAEADRQKQKEREQSSQAEAKKNAQRQAAIEKAKQTRAPPPAVRSQPNGPPDFALAQDKGLTGNAAQKSDGANRPLSRMAPVATRQQEESGRPVSTLLSNASKASTKRPLPQETNDDPQLKQSQGRAGPSYQAKDAKRRRTSEAGEERREVDRHSNMKGPPVRPSSAYKKDMTARSLFQTGYANAPQTANRDLFKATVNPQHGGQAKVPIPFAPNPNPAGTSHKTPARQIAAQGGKSVAKSATRSSPRFQNGDLIELPEIQTDDEDEDEDEGAGMNVAPWAASPEIRKALLRQETMDPATIFGPPAPLNMEEVFSKSKDRWHKFRARTSSANWSGADRLTEEEIRKDLAARDRLRRDGCWTYDMGKDML